MGHFDEILARRTSFILHLYHVNLDVVLWCHVWCQKINWQSLLGGSFDWYLDVI